jgi:hypothetical protein
MRANLRVPVSVAQRAAAISQVNRDGERNAGRVPSSHVLACAAGESNGDDAFVTTWLDVADSGLRG